MPETKVQFDNLHCLTFGFVAVTLTDIEIPAKFNENEICGDAKTSISLPRRIWQCN